MLSGCMCMLLSWFGALLSIYAGGLDDGKSELYYSSYVLKFFFGAFLALFCCFYAFSLGPLGWVASVEIFPARARAKASAACTSCYSLSYILGAWLLDSWRVRLILSQPVVILLSLISHSFVSFICIGNRYADKHPRYTTVHRRVLRRYFHCWSRVLRLPPGDEPS